VTLTVFVAQIVVGSFQQRATTHENETKEGQLVHLLSKTGLVSIIQHIDLAFNAFVVVLQSYTN
jgi:hypothetical protein